MSRLMAEFDYTCTSPTTKLWLMYMDMLMTLKRFVHAERAGLWDQHLAEVEKMMPYLVAAGHYKYVSCLPHYFAAMRALPTWHQTLPWLSIMASSQCVKQRDGSTVFGQTCNLRKPTTMMPKPSCSRESASNQQR